MENKNMDKVLIYSLVKPLLLMGLLLWLGQSQSTTSQVEKTEMTNEQHRSPYGISHQQALESSKKEILASHFRQQDLKRVAPMIHPRSKGKFYKHLGQSGFLLNKCIELHVKLEKKTQGWEKVWMELKSALQNLTSTQHFIASRISSGNQIVGQVSPLSLFGKNKI